jgi:CubicO group peptidase (beta-lactamase class C family)
MKNSPVQYTRREWLGVATAGALVISCDRRLPTRLAADTALDARLDSGLDADIERLMREGKIPGLAAAIVKGDRLVWSHGYGWANIKQGVRMDPARSIQNIASTSKTVTATAVMQLFEQGKFGLDDDVNRYLPFPVRNPHHPGIPITFRQLLTHRSSIADGPAYGASYGCGDPSMNLFTWLEAYLTPQGRFYNPTTNFHPWKPGEQGDVKSPLGRNYSNVGFGLLGFLVESVAGVPFPQYCQAHIFGPLGMTNTGWMLKDINRPSHAALYTAPDESDAEETKRLQNLGFLGRDWERPDSSSTAYLPFCLYSFPNYPDGTVRTSVDQLARFLIAFMNGGTSGGVQLLKPATVASMLTPQVKSDPKQGLCFFNIDLGENRVWGHDGADPGVGTMMFFRPSDGVGVIVFETNLSSALKDVTLRLFAEAAHL